MRTAVMLLLFAHVSADAEAEPGWGRTIGRGILTAGKYSVKGARIRELKNSTLERAIEQKDNHKTQETVVINFMIVLVILFVVVFFTN